MSRRKTSGNRTDLLTRPQPVKVATGQPYGHATALAQSQAAQPLPQAAVPPEVAAQQAAQATPAPVQPIHAPTTRPNEPLTAGMVPPNAGVGPDPTLAMLKGVYARFPSPAILGLINEAQARGQT